MPEGRRGRPSRPTKRLSAGVRLVRVGAGTVLDRGSQIEGSAPGSRIARLERLQLRARVEAELLAEHVAGMLVGRAAPPPADRRGRGRASGTRGAVRAGAPPRPAARARPPARRDDPAAGRRRCGPRAPPTAAPRGGSPRGGADRLRRPSVRGRATPQGERVAQRRAAASSTAPDASASRPRGPPPRSTERRSRRPPPRAGSPPAPVVKASLSGPSARRSFETSACSALAPPAGGSSPQSSSARRSAWTVSRGPNEQEEQEQRAAWPLGWAPRRRRRPPGARPASGTRTGGRYARTRPGVLGSDRPPDRGQRPIRGSSAPERTVTA